MVETILLAEDDTPIRRLIGRSLDGQGYQLLEACDGLEALQLAAKHRGPIDLLFADIVMPQMDGFTLSERLVESHPETRVLLMSGQADQSVGVRGGLKESGQAFLLKPFTRDFLLQTIREQLNAPNTGGPSRHRRVSFDVDVRVEHAGRPARTVGGRLVVLGADGAFLELDEAYPIGALMHVRFELPTLGGISCQAIVRNVNEGTEVGVEFLFFETVRPHIS